MNRPRGSDDLSNRSTRYYFYVWDSDDSDDDEDIQQAIDAVRHSPRRSSSTTFLPVIARTASATNGKTAPITAISRSMPIATYKRES